MAKTIDYKKLFAFFKIFFKSKEKNNIFFLYYYYKIQFKYKK